MIDILKKKEKNQVDTFVDWENIFAMGCLVMISWMATSQADNLPSVINTIAGGFIGYLTRARQQMQTVVLPNANPNSNSNLNSNLNPNIKNTHSNTNI